MIDSFASHEYFKNEIMPTYKQSVGLQYAAMTENSYKKFDIDVALPLTSRDAVSFVKVDAFQTRAHHFFDEKLKLVWLV